MFDLFGIFSIFMIKKICIKEKKTKPLSFSGMNYLVTELCIGI